MQRTWWPEAGTIIVTGPYRPISRYYSHLVAVRGRCSIVTCMRVRWVSHTRKYTQWNIFLFESSDKSPYWTNPYHIGFRCETSLNFHTYFGQCPNDTYILLHFPLYVCSNYPHTGLTTATAPSGHQMAVVTCDQSIPCHAPGVMPGVMPLPHCGRAEFSEGDFFVGRLLLGRVVYKAEFSGYRSTGPLFDLRYMFRQTKEWRQAAEPAYGYRCFDSKRKSEASTKLCPYLAHWCVYNTFS